MLLAPGKSSANKATNSSKSKGQTFFNGIIAFLYTRMDPAPSTTNWRPP
jgi:hypothetical protein